MPSEAADRLSTRAQPAPADVVERAWHYLKRFRGRDGKIQLTKADLRQALAPPRSIRVSDLTDEEVEAMRKPPA
jgi:hypothetical protein